MNNGEKSAQALDASFSGACTLGDHATIMSFLMSGAVRPRTDHVLLTAAATKPDPDILKLLLQYGAPVKDSKLGVLDKACKSPDFTVEALNVLIAAGAPLRISSIQRTVTPSVHIAPIAAAVSANNLAVVQRLMEAGADIHARDEGSGMDAIMTAVTRPCSKELLVLLVRAGADLTQRDAGGLTPVMRLASNSNAQSDALAYLVKACNKEPSVFLGYDRVGAYISGRELTLGVAARASPRNLVVVLLSAHVRRQVTMHNSEGNSPLHALIKQQLLQTTPAGSAVVMSVNILVRAGVDVNGRDHKQQTPLHLAIERSSVAITEALLALGADPNAADSKGNTPLHCMAARAYLTRSSRIVRALLSAGADPTLTNAARKTPYMELPFNDRTGDFENVLALLTPRPQKLR